MVKGRKTLRHTKTNTRKTRTNGRNGPKTSPKHYQMIFKIFETWTGQFLDHWGTQKWNKKTSKIEKVVKTIEFGETEHTTWESKIPCDQRHLPFSITVPNFSQITDTKTKSD